MTDAAETYDPHRFKTTVPYYARYRLSYPDRLIAWVIERAGLQPADAVLDLGCGPGTLAVPFAQAGMTVTAVDPEPAMLDAVRGAAAQAGVALDIRQGSSFDLPAGIGPFRLVTMGRSFHWMDRAATLKILDGLVTPKGALAFFRDEHPQSAENLWHRKMLELVMQYGAENAPHRQARKRDDFRSHESVLLDSAFAHLERIAVLEKRAVTADEIVGRAFSLSISSPAALGERTEAFERDLRTMLATLSPDGRFGEIAETDALIATRP